MKKHFVIPALLITLFLMLACSFSYEGIALADDNEPDDPIREMIGQQTREAAQTEETGSESVEATPEPEYQPVAPSGSDGEQAIAGQHEYAVTATNFECICQDTGPMTVDLKFTGNQLEITNEGGAPMVYEKVSDNQYQRTFMGYYILTSGEGDQATETKVEEENRTVIILTGSGYVMESYKGESSSPCCYYTFELQK